uniref:Uncharacterized protein n=1 Tax=Panagrolaimus superbus TaxID=310955 RepID=A0A914YRT1_9BILA
MSQLLLFQDSIPSNRNLIIDVVGDIYDSAVNSLNVSTGQVKKYNISWTETAQFLDKLQSLFDLTQVKAIVIRAMEYEVMTFKESYEFRLKCKEFCDKNGIFYFVGNDIHLNAIAAVSKTCTMVKEGEQVMIVMSKLLDLVFVVKLIREKGYYRYLSSQMLYCPMMIPCAFWDFEPKKVIILHNTGANQSAKEEINEMLKKHNPIFLHQGDEDELEKEAVINKVLHLMGERNNQYDVRVACTQAWFHVRVNEKCLIKIIPNEVLPMEKSVIINVDPTKSVSLFAKFEVIPFELLQEIKLLTLNTKKAKITIKVDINLFYDFVVEPFGKPIQPPSPTPKVRISFNLNTFSVYLQNKNKEYILEDFDELKKTPLYISFNEKKPIIGKSALKLYETKPAFVVFDLIRISSISNADLQNPKWGFKLEKENESMMVTVNTFEGERRTSVDLLLALILKHARLLVKNEIGKKMDEIEVEFNSFIANDMLKKNFIEAGKLINVKVVLD